MIKDQIKNTITKSVEKYLLKNSMEILSVGFEVEIPKNEQFGDYSSNVALVLSKKIQKMSREVACDLAEVIEVEDEGFFKKIEVAGPGFINFKIAESVFLNSLMEIHTAGTHWGRSEVGKGKRVLVEFVSANPTGHLHFGHARNAAVGESISRILEFCGYEVTKEFYINDAGRQMQLLGESVLARYKLLLKTEAAFPEDGYKGEYVESIAEKLIEEVGSDLIEADNREAEKKCTEFAYAILLNEIKSDLKNAGIEFDNWYSEKNEIHDKTKRTNKLEEVREVLDRNKCLYENEDAIWFRSTDYGDTQDWVLVKKNGEPTYFYSDIAYHYDKIKRGFDVLINVWGADHHSHVSRLKSAMKAMNNDGEILDCVLIQFVRLVKDNTEVPMSKREGSYVTLREVISEVGADATRFFLLMRSTDRHLDFDLDLAKEESSENPVYYVQYAHARIESLLAKAKDQRKSPLKDHLELLTLSEEMDLVKKLLNFQDIVIESAKSRSPHKIVFYLLDLASDLHSYYKKNKILTDNEHLTSARLYLIICVQVVMKNGLQILGIKAPRRM